MRRNVGENLGGPFTESTAVEKVKDNKDHAVWSYTLYQQVKGSDVYRLYGYTKEMLSGGADIFKKAGSFVIIPVSDWAPLQQLQTGTASNAVGSGAGESAKSVSITRLVNFRFSEN